MEIKVPEVGESVFEALVAKWHREDGDQVAKDEPLCEIETDKITLEINAEVGGVLRIKVPAGTTVKIGSVIGLIDEMGMAKEKGAPGKTKEPQEKPAIEPPASAVTQPAPTQHISPTERKAAREKQVKVEEKPEPAPLGRTE